MPQTMQDSSETAQAESEGPDGSDKPPHENTRQRKKSSRRSSFRSLFNGSGILATGDSRSSTPAPAVAQVSSVPLPPPEAGAFPKEPGFTKGTLGHLVMQQQAATSTVHKAGHVHADGSETPSSMESPAGSDTDSWPASTPSSRPGSRSNSRAPSMSQEKSGFDVGKRSRHTSFSEKKDDSVTTTHANTTPTQQVASPAESTPSTIRPKIPSRPPSVHSETGGQKFTLKDLLANGPKLTRKSSARSTASSRKSDSDGDRRSTAGDSTASLSKKYGVCERVAIGKGATSVVRLAHKWDRSEEKLYAVKVRSQFLCGDSNIYST